MTNYNPSVPGTPYVRVNQLILDWPDALGGIPTATVFQCNAVVLTDGTVRHLDSLPQFQISLDLANHGNDPIPLIDPVNGTNLGANTTLNQAFMAILAVLRQAQIANNK